MFAGIAPSVAYRINNQVSVGVSLPIMYSQYTLEKAVFNGVPGSADGTFKLKADGFGMGFAVGLLYELTDHDVTYIQFGDGKFTARDVPLVGDIRGKYTTNWGLVFGLGMKW